ncbi:MAG: hypothetical protein BMS9Abin02_2153 [Anaerolineae bacterium]|nr:MAG: hypothetical protein BMS9Abin02_2153 [Anaerolineae bacterium]
MSDELIQPPINRREFIKAAALSAVIATSAGTTAALLVAKNKGSTSMPALIQDIEPPVIGQGQRAAEIINQLISVQVENARLRTQLRSAENKLEVAEIRRNGRESDITNALQAQLESSANQNITLAEEVTLLSGLVALYEQLEAIDLESLLDSGITTVEGTFDDLLLQVPIVQEGLASGQEAIIDLESQIPSLESGRLWLAGQFDTLGTHLDDLEMTLKETIKTAGPILQQLGQWFQDISKWLPFGIGDKAGATMDSLSQVLQDILQTKEDLPDQLAGPLANLLDKEGDETAIERSLINPLRMDLINPTAQAMEQTKSLGAMFKADLVAPFTAAVEERSKIVALIADYRQSQQI